MSDMPVNRIGVVSLVAALALGAAAATAAGGWVGGRGDAQALAAQARTVAELQGQLAELRANDPNWAGVAAQAGPSVVTVVTDRDLGSGWVAHSDKGGADIITNFHVVAETYDSGLVSVTVTQGDRSMNGEITRIDREDDLAVVHVSEPLKALPIAALRPKIGTPVMDLGSPLGLTGTVSVGVVSAYRSMFGSDYLQFSAAISPGNSGGPVVDSRGRVVGIATGKIVAQGADGLAFAIPVEMACAWLVDCQPA